MVSHYDMCNGFLNDFMSVLSRSKDRNALELSILANKGIENVTAEAVGPGNIKEMN